MTIQSTCPYPWCPSSKKTEGGTIAVASVSSVASCTSCGSMASRCPERVCGAWNRAFVRWCRRCGRDLRDAVDVWETLRTAGPVGGPTGIGPAEVVADLSNLDGPTTLRSHRVAIAAVQGFLALHQAGGFVALIPPFSRSEIEVSYGFREPETRTKPAPAFNPVIMPGGRFLLLADRRGAAIVDLWETGISAASPTGVGPRRLTLPKPVAARPIPLTETRVGLMLGETAPYSWMIWDHTAPEPSPAVANASLRPMPILGGPCETTLVGKESLAFATHEGHWAWRLEDASAGKVETIKPTWTAGSETEALRVSIGRQVEYPEGFTSPGQVFLWDEPGGPFTWLFRTLDGRARSYRVNASTLDIDDRYDYEEITPVGLAVRPNQTRPSIIFDKNDMLQEERDLRGKPIPCQVSLPGEGKAGLQLVGTLVVTVRNSRTGGGSRSIQIQSLWGGRTAISTEEITGLASDPFVWSGHLFTVERSGNDRLTLVRRALIAPTEVPR